MTDRTHRNLGRLADLFGAIATAGALAGVVAIAWAIIAATPDPCADPNRIAYGTNSGLVYCEGNLR